MALEHSAPAPTATWQFSAGARLLENPSLVNSRNLGTSTRTQALASARRVAAAGGTGVWHTASTQAVHPKLAGPCPNPRCLACPCPREPGAGGGVGAGHPLWMLGAGGGWCPMVPAVPRAGSRRAVGTHSGPGPVSADREGCARSCSAGQERLMENRNHSDCTVVGETLTTRAWSL